MQENGRKGLRCEIGVVLLLGLVVALGFGVAVRGEFVWDDRPLIVENDLVQDPAHLGTLLTSGFWETGDRHDRFRAFFRPVVSLTYTIDHALWGLTPAGFHLTNLLLHWLCCWLVFRILVGENLAPRAAFLGAALFAAHPVHVENVAWISGRTDLLCAALMFGAFAVYRRRAAVGLRSPSVAALALFALAIFAKEMAATLPLLIGLDAWFRADTTGAVAPRDRLRRTAIAALPFLTVLAAYVVARRLLLGPGSAALFELEGPAFVATALYALGRYFTLLLLPIGLDAHHPDQPLGALFEPPAIVAALILATVLFAAWRLRRQAPRAAFWILWIPVALVPVMAFGRFGDVILADRFLYIPSVGLAALFAFGCAWLAKAPRPLVRRLTVAAAALLVVGLALASAGRSRVWRDDLTLFTDMARTSPDSALVRCNLGLAHYQRNELDRAIGEFEKAIEVEPGYAMAHNNIAAAYQQTGRPLLALEHYLASLEIAPEQFEAGVNTGQLYTRIGRPQEGIARLRDAVSRFPRSARAHYHLGEALERTGRADAALPFLETARQLDPDYAHPYYLLGKTYRRQGRRAEAEAALRRFLELWPQDDAWAESARTLLRDGRS